jgi:hypothetical protein
MFINKTVLLVSALIVSSVFFASCSNYDLGNVGSIQLCSTVKDGATTVRNKTATFKMVLAYRSTGNFVKTAGDGVTVLDANGQGCVSVTTPEYPNVHQSGGFGKAAEFLNTYRIISVSVSTDAGEVLGEVTGSNAGGTLAVDPNVENYMIVRADAKFDYQNPNTGSAGEF